jgi:PAS domain S-box-containing protein
VATEELIAVIDEDLARRVAVVEAIAAHGFQAFGVSEMDRLHTEQRVPALMVLRVMDRAHLEEAVLATGGSSRLGLVPLIVVGSFESDVRAVDAFASGAVDYVDEDVELGELCSRIEARLHDHRTVTTLDRRRGNAELLLELTHALSSTVELHNVLYGVVKRVAEVIDVARVSIVLCGEDDRGYVIAASDDETLRDLPIKLSRYPEIGEVLRTGKPTLIEDARTHPLFELPQVALPSRYQSLMLFPIQLEDEPLGVLFLRFEEARKLREEDAFALVTIANATGIALRNANLVKSLRAQSSRSWFAQAEAEKQLQALRRFADYFDSSADGIIVMSVEGEVLFCNPSACQICEHDEEDLRGRDFASLLSRDGRSRFEKVRAALGKAEYPRNLDLPIRTPKGRRRILSVSFSSVRREHDSVMVSLRDVTEARTLARELTKTKEFLQRVIDSSVDAIVSADLKGKVLLFNPAAEETYGYAAVDVVGKMNVRDLYPGDTATTIMHCIRAEELGGPGVLQGFETELLGKDGTTIPVMLSASLIRHRGRPIGSVGVFKDLRAERHIARRLAAAQKELEVQEKKAFVAELAGAAAHELNQPLTAVMGYADMISRTLEGESQLKRATDRIVTETERMAEIVRKIGKLTHYESKAYVGDTKIIDIERSVDHEPPVTGR